MIPNIERGGRMAGLMNYLVGPGRSNEHENPHMIAGDDRISFSYENGVALSKYDAFEIAELLDAPRKAFGTEVTKPVYARDPETRELLKDENGKSIKTGSSAAHVWHCSLAIGETEGKLSDEKWAQISSAFVNKMGFVDPDGAKSSRWAAVHHGSSKNGNDHVHIVVQMVREDGTKASTHNDFHRAQKACRELEVEFGLQSLESSAAQQKGLSGEKAAERSRAGREGYAVTDRVELRRRMRAALVSSSDANDFVRQLPKMGVHVAPRFAKDSTTTVTGYKVSLGTKDGENAVWYAPSKLDNSLSWPAIKTRFKGAGVEEAEKFLASRHSSAHVQRGKGFEAFDLTPQAIDKLMSNKTGPDHLANIYARLSIEVEGNKPGTLSRMSEHMARAGQGQGNRSYAIRLNERFASKSSEAGWMAVLKQANRLSHVMLQGQLVNQRPGLATAAQQVVRSAERIVREAEREMQNSTVTSHASRSTSSTQGYGE